MSLTVAQARKFFGSLYDREHAPDLPRFDAAAMRLIASAEEGVPTKDTAAGDKALAILMLNHIMSAPKISNADRAALTAAALLNIKSDVVGRFVELFPDMTLEELKRSATAAGYHVDVLPAKEAAHLPRTVVGR